jgi:hypothetical protein
LSGFVHPRARTADRAVADEHRLLARHNSRGELYQR